MDKPDGTEALSFFEEGDPRNPATIADNVGDCAGMAADLFESYEVTLVPSIILGVAAFQSIDAKPALGTVFPLAARAVGVIASIARVFAVKAKPGETNAPKPINRGFLTAGVLTVFGTAIALGWPATCQFPLYLVALCGTGMLATPALLAVLTPVIIGFGISWQALDAFLAGQLMAVYLSNSGGAWDNAKEYIEDGHEGGNGSQAHRRRSSGTRGDPFKDTAGPALTR